MPADAPGKYFMARIRGGDVAAISSQMGTDAPPRLEHVHLGRQRRRDRRQGPRGRRQRAERAVRRLRLRPHGRVRRPEGAAFCVWQPNQHRGARVVNEHGTRQLQRPPHPRRRGREGVLRRGLRLGAARHGRRRRHVDAARRTATTSRSSTPGRASACGEMGAPARFERRRREPSAARTTGRRAAHWGVTFGRRRRRRDRRAARAELGGDGARRRRSTRRGCARTVIRDPQGATFTASQFVPENKDMAGQDAAALAAHERALGGSVSRSTTASSGRPRPL